MPRPFAEHFGDYTVTVAGHHLETPGMVGRGANRDIAERINAAVEQREAKLRGALAASRHALYVARVALVVSRSDEHPDLPVVLQAIGAATDALGPNPPDYVPKAELDAANAKLKAYGAAVDLLYKHESMTRAEVCAWLEYAGLKKPAPIEEWSDEEVTRRLEAAKAEEKRRMAIEHIFREQEYGFAGGRHTVTGTSFCGKSLGHGGLWVAVTIDSFRRDGLNGKTCAECHERLKIETARVA